MRSESKTWLTILGCVSLFLGGEAMTVILFGYPMSHAMADAPEIAGLLLAFFFGLLLAHFRWPAKSRWREQDDYISRHGDPSTLRSLPLGRIWGYADALWLIHTAKGKSLKGKP